MKKIIQITLLALLLPCLAMAQDYMNTARQPEVPVTKWKGKKILFIGAHPDDDQGSQGTLAMLKDHGNEVWVLIMTTGNVGTKDPKMSRDHLARIRRMEELNALKAIGVPADHYINLGYDDGRLQYSDREETVKRLVYYIRKIHPDVLFAFDPGHGYQRWHKADHRRASYLAADAARAAEWPLLFQGQIIQEGLKAWEIPSYMFYDSKSEDVNTWVDISGYVDQKVNAATQYVSQNSSSFFHYTPNVPKNEEAKIIERIRSHIHYKNGKPVEQFRFYHGIPDGIGK